MARTLVSGGTGFLGINVVRDLAEHGREVVAVDVGAPDELCQRYLRPWRERVTWVVGDLRDPEVLAEAAARPLEEIVHAAAFTPYGEEEKTAFRHTADNNLGGLASLLDLAGEQRVRRIIGLSTMAVYTHEYAIDPERPVVFGEEMALLPNHVYGITKVAEEALLRRYGQLFGIETASVRLAQNWGPMERVTPYHARLSIPWYWARQAAAGEPIEVSPYGAGVTEGRCLNQDHPYVLDTAAAIRALLEAPRLDHDAYNISTGEPIFVAEMSAAMAQASPATELVAPDGADRPAPRAGVSLDAAKLREDTGFEFSFDLATALAHCIEWRREAGVGGGNGNQGEDR